MCANKIITVEGELTLRNAEAVRDKIINRRGNNSKVNINLKNMADIDYAGVQLLMSALLSNYLESVSINKLHPELEKLIVNTGFDSIIKNLK